MKANRLLVSFAVSAALFSTTAMAIDGTIKFTGDIVDTPCVVAQKSQNQTINLGQVKQSSLNGTVGLTSAGTQFQIVLEDCKLDPTTPEKAYITFTGISSQPNVLDVAMQQGGATGVGIQITDAKGNAIPINTQHTNASDLVDGQNVLDFKAAYISTAAAVTTGHADGQADFQFQYK
ncbi:fimbrial protein [Enterobacter hormaechei subsp. xiangfangensis]|uniref:fimbrial protein n=1 Tax=Enterobacter hormaechei TaxID=158836 RepID=UPI003F42B84F